MNVIKFDKVLPNPKEFLAAFDVQRFQETKSIMMMLKACPAFTISRDSIAVIQSLQHHNQMQ